MEKVHQTVGPKTGRYHWIPEFNLSKLSDCVYRYFHSASFSFPSSVDYCGTGMKASSSLPVMRLGHDPVGPSVPKPLFVSLCRAPLPSLVEMAKPAMVGRLVPYFCSYREALGKNRSFIKAQLTVSFLNTIKGQFFCPYIGLVAILDCKLIL